MTPSCSSSFDEAESGILEFLFNELPDQIPSGIFSSVSGFRWLLMHEVNCGF